MTAATLPQVTVPTTIETVWLYMGNTDESDTTLDVHDTGMNFLGLADDVYIPLNDMRVFLDDQAQIEGVTVTEHPDGSFTMDDSNSGTYEYAPMLLGEQVVYHVEGFGFARLGDDDED